MKALPVPWQMMIANAISAAEERKLLGVEIENDGDVEPFRLFHFANAL